MFFHLDPAVVGAAVSGIKKYCCLYCIPLRKYIDSVFLLILQMVFCRIYSQLFTLFFTGFCSLVQKDGDHSRLALELLSGSETCHAEKEGGRKH